MYTHAWAPLVGGVQIITRDLAAGIRQLVSLIREADVVHIANPALVPLALGWLLRKRVVVEHSGYQAACPNGLLLFGPDGSVCEVTKFHYKQS